MSFWFWDVLLEAQVVFFTGLRESGSLKCECIHCDIDKWLDRNCRCCSSPAIGDREPGFLQLILSRMMVTSRGERSMLR